MQNLPPHREIMIPFSEAELATLNLLSERLNISIPDIVRSLVPNLPLPTPLAESPIQTVSEPIPPEGPHKIRENYNLEKLKEICDELIKNKMAKTLADEIIAQVVVEGHQRETLNKTTEKRLLRWAHPARVDERTKFVKPKAREICMDLYGFVPERVD